MKKYLKSVGSLFLIWLTLTLLVDLFITKTFEPTAKYFAGEIFVGLLYALPMAFVGDSIITLTERSTITKSNS